MHDNPLEMILETPTKAAKTQKENTCKIQSWQSEHGVWSLIYPMSASTQFTNSKFKHPPKDFLLEKKTKSEIARG